MANYVIKINDNIDDFSERCDEVVTMQDYQAAKGAASKLKETLAANPKIIALSAPQIGVHERLFVARFGKELKVFMNPIIINSSKTEFLSEEEYVFTNNPKRMIIHRPDEITVGFQDVYGNVQQLSFKNMTVVPILQMIDMLDGVLADVIKYTALEINTSWDNKNKKEKEEILKNWEDMLKENAKAFQEEIASDPELQNIVKDIELKADYLNGKIKPVDKDGNVVEK